MEFDEEASDLWKKIGLSFEDVAGTTKEADVGSSTSAGVSIGVEQADLVEWQLGLTMCRLLTLSPSPCLA